MFLFNRFSHINYYAALVVGLLLISPWGLAEENAGHETDSEADHRIIKSHYFAAQGESKYPSDFKHFDYVNPDAPKGGQIVLSQIGTFDNFNRYAQRGDAAIMSGELYDTLMVSSDDEISVFYPLIAESLEYPENYAWVIFNINPAAKDQGGEPITAEDVAFTFKKFMDQGVPFFRNNYKNVTQAEVLNSHQVKFHLETPNREDILNLVDLPVMPKRFWEDKNFSEPLNTPPLGTGPYKVSNYKIGQQVTYELIEDYWAKDLPSRKGMYNIQSIRHDYYRDHNVSLEAFLAGAYDFRQENIAKQWAEEYKGPAVRRSDIKLDEISHDIPQPLQGFVFNTQRPMFSDRRVREALNYAMDFEWMNKNLFYGQYQRSYSYFQNTPYMASGKPTQSELEVLTPFKDQLPEAVFEQTVWVPNKTDGSGNIRPSLRKAIALLNDAGWTLKEGKMTNSKTGKPLEFDLLIYTASGERVALPFKRNLERMGVTMNLRQVDSTQFLNRLRSRDFDMIFQGYRANPYPHPAMKITWQSDYIDSTYNQAGVQDPVIDALIKGIEENQQNAEQLKAYGHAFDRVARWNFYIVPHWHSNNFRIAYWNKFSQPEVRPRYSIGLDTWWYDPDKAASIKQ
ncbi:extracellular solute-binding protein [Marinimicrobium sp. ARAG 43.8]|uniref:extracellular solute-binding protein n=1 Tax=Marinimicrobium sp. ARAG 43.8 TaxID=3418719 RepID=UPI003CEF3594